MPDPETQTRGLLRRWNRGDRAALATLLERDLPRIRAHVRRRMGAVLRANDQTDDLVHDAVIRVLEEGPRFEVSDADRFRALVGRMAENLLRMQHRALHRECRDVRRERRLPTAIDLDSPITSPSRAATRSEDNAWLQLGIELLGPESREVLVLRQWEGLDYPEIGARLGIDKDAARMRFRRAVARLGGILRQLRAGRLDAVIAELPPP